MTCTVIPRQVKVRIAIIW